jgi:uncharacterized protein (TIGR02266 family)
MPSDRGSTRAHERLAFEIQIDIVSEHNLYAGLSQNISKGGLFVATHVSHPVGTRLEIRLLLPGDVTATTLLTEVRWIRPRGDDGEGSAAGLGLRFVDLPPDVLPKLAEFASNRDPLYYDESEEYDEG